MPKKKGKSHRKLIDTGTNNRFGRRDDKGQFAESTDVARSLTQDRKQEAKRKVPAGQGDRGDSEAEVTDIAGMALAQTPANVAGMFECRARHKFRDEGD